MPRYFIEVTYCGKAYSGFQIQNNANTIQAEIEKALQTFLRTSVELTGSSRTDAGVHAVQNFFHLDSEIILNKKHIYHINAILPEDIAIKSIQEVVPAAHCRFDALSREYQYFLHTTKNPFLSNQSWQYPFPVNLDLLNEAAAIITEYSNFESFSKRNTQVATFECSIEKSYWSNSNNQLIYTVKGNRFLRGMVRGLVGTMLKVGRQKLTLDQFRKIIESKDCTKADFSTPPHGLFLTAVNYPSNIFV